SQGISFMGGTGGRRTGLVDRGRFDGGQRQFVERGDEIQDAGRLADDRLPVLGGQGPDRGQFRGPTGHRFTGPGDRPFARRVVGRRTVLYAGRRGESRAFRTACHFRASTRRRRSSPTLSMVVTWFRSRKRRGTISPLKRGSGGSLPTTVPFSRSTSR